MAFQGHGGKSRLLIFSFTVILLLVALPGLVVMNAVRQIHRVEEYMLNSRSDRRLPQELISNITDRIRYRKMEAADSSDNLLHEVPTPFAPDNEPVRHKDVDSSLQGLDLPDYNVIAFYYPWYGNPAFDGKYIHWRHEVLDGSKRIIEPPDDIAADFYPALGTYSSRDPEIIKQHMIMLNSAKIGTLSVSWWGRNQADEQGGYTDKLMHIILDVAQQYGIKVCIHLEPYKNRSAKSVSEDLDYLRDHYHSHEAMFRWSKQNNRPLVFVYDSYLIQPSDWEEMFDQRKERKVPLSEEFMIIGLVVEKRHLNSLKQAGFDGMYSYFATDGFTFGSTLRNWPDIQKFARENHMLFIPSVGPGYADLKIRPWNIQNQRPRTPEYYDREWDAALGLEPEMISITSWNEWHEGTQIEPCASRPGFAECESLPPDHFLTQTKQWIDEWHKNQSGPRNNP